MDIQIIKDLFAYYVIAANLLEVDQDYVEQVLIARNRLVPSLIGKDGSLQEWTEDYEQLEGCVPVAGGNSHHPRP